MKSKLFVFIVCFISITNLKSQVFTEMNTALPPITNVPSMDWGDYNNNGYEDLLIAGQKDSAGLPPFCYILSYNGNTFDIINLNVNHSNTPFVKWIDYDNDGDLDFLYSGYINGANKTLLYENNAGVFTEKNLNINYSGHIAVGDLNNNGYKDFVLISGWSQQPYTAVYLNDSAHFYAISNPLMPLLHATAAIGDYNNDGHNDLVISGETDVLGAYKVLLYKNTGNAIFTPVINSFDSIRGYVSFGDYNNDSLLDILVSGIHNYNNPIVKLYKNEGNDVFSDSNTNLPAISGKTVFFDFNNDNALDILIAGKYGTYPNATTLLRIFENNAQGAFTILNPQLSNQYGEIAVGDFNNDGFPDFAISGPNQIDGSGYTTRIYKNNLNTSIKENAIYASYALYPNPANDFCNIYQENAALIYDIDIIDLKGSIIKVPFQIVHNGCSIDLNNLNKGFYFVKVKEKNITSVYKLIKN